MADAAEVLPLPEEEPANEAPQGDDSAAADDSGKDVSFGTFLTVGPKEYRNVTIVGYDNLRGSVRAVRRSGDSVENIQIPYEQYKTIIEAQKESDKATGRTTKKNLSKAVRGYFGKSVSLDGKQSQVIGYDAQTDEVLVNDGAGRRWIKTGEMLGGMQRGRKSATITDADYEYLKHVEKKQELLDKARKEFGWVFTAEGENNAKDMVERYKRALTLRDPEAVAAARAELEGFAGKIAKEMKDDYLKVKEKITSSDLGDFDAAALKSLDDFVKKLDNVKGMASLTKAMTDHAVTNKFIQDEIRSLNEKKELKISLTEKKTDTTVTVEAKSTGAGSPAPTSIREMRAEMKASRSSGGALVQSAAAAVATVATAIPASSNAAAVVAAAQNVLATYGASATKRDGQIQQISNQISEASNRINDLQQRSRESQAGGNEEQAGQYEQQIVQAQSNRTSLLNQQTDLQVAGINENNQASKIVEAVKQLVPDAGGAIPDEKVSAVERLLPNRSASKIAPSTPSVTGAVLQAPKKPALPRTFAPGIPSRTSSARPNPSARTPKPLRPLGGSLGAVGGQTQRAVDFNAAQQYDRGAPSDSSRLGDSSEEALATEGGRPGYSGPLDLPERKPATYAAGADDEPEAADIYGAQEEAGRAEMKRIHSTLTPDDQSQDQGPLSTETSGRPAYEEAEAPAQAGAPSGPTPEELARASALQQIMAQDMLQRNQQQDQAGAQGSAAQAESTKKKIQSAKQLISDLIDAFDALHGLADVLGLLVTIAHVNLRLVLTIFKKDFPFIPRANFPFECTIIGFFDLMVCLSVLSTLMGFVVILAALVAALSSATFGLSEFFDLF